MYEFEMNNSMHSALTIRLGERASVGDYQVRLCGILATGVFEDMSLVVKYQTYRNNGVDILVAIQDGKCKTYKRFLKYGETLRIEGLRLTFRDFEMANGNIQFNIDATSL